MTMTMMEAEAEEEVVVMAAEVQMEVKLRATRFQRIRPMCRFFLILERRTAAAMVVVAHSYLTQAGIQQYRQVIQVRTLRPRMVDQLPSHLAQEAIRLQGIYC
jgi:hypothetical protein